MGFVTAAAAAAVAALLLLLLTVLMFYKEVFLFVVMLSPKQLANCAHPRYAKTKEHANLQHFLMRRVL